MEVEVALRRVQIGDHAEVLAVFAAAFPQSGVEELAITEALWADSATVAAGCLVAMVEGAVVGAVIASTAALHPGGGRAVGLGPVAVLPRLQGRGIGGALVRASLEALSGEGVVVVGLLGDPGFYGPQGFVAASDRGVKAPVETWGAHFMVNATAPHLEATFVYHHAFGVDAEAT